MKKSKRSQRKALRHSAGSKADARVDPQKRMTLRLLRNGAIVLVGVSGAGVFGVRAVQATIREADLTQIGKGIPTVVQIHDPQCSLCTTLQKQTRKALKAHDEAQVTYLVANIKTRDGAALASQYGVPHVTLLFFDASGALTDTLHGPTRTDVIRAALARHLSGGKPAS